MWIVCFWVSGLYAGFWCCVGFGVIFWVAGLTGFVVWCMIRVLGKTGFISF